MLNLSPPWMIFFKEIEALFKGDPEVRVSFDEDDNVINLYVDNPEKASALEKLLPMEKAFGSVTVEIRVIPANGLVTTKATLFEQAFAGNPIFAYLKSSSKGIYSDFAYVVFKREIAQFYADVLSDLHGYKSMLYQDIAKDIFGDVTGIFFCTDTKE